MKKGKFLFVLDVENLYIGQKNVNCYLDISKLAKLVRSINPNTEMFAFCCYRYYMHQEIIKALNCHGFRIINVEKDFRKDLIDEAIADFIRNNMDQYQNIIIGTGDSHFAEITEIAKENGNKVLLVGIKGLVGKKIKHSVHHIYYLNDVERPSPLIDKHFLENFIRASSNEMQTMFQTMCEPAKDALLDGWVTVQRIIGDTSLKKISNLKDYKRINTKNWADINLYCTLLKKYKRKVLKLNNNHQFTKFLKKEIRRRIEESRTILIKHGNSMEMFEFSYQP